MEAIIIILVILILILLFKRTFSSAIYAIVIVDIFLRLVDFLRSYIKFTGEIGKFFSKIPGSLNIVIKNATSGVFTDILLWGLFIIYVIFLYYVIRYFMKKR